MKVEKLAICVFTLVYSCFVVFVPDNPNLYTLTVNLLSSIISFTACVILQAFLISRPQPTLLGGLCIQFLFAEEVAIIYLCTLTFLTNIQHFRLITFNSDYPEVAKYVLNTRPVACLVCASVTSVSAARLVLIASPAYYQGINRRVCLSLSSVFLVVTVLADFLVNHVKCLVIHTKDYESKSILYARIQLGITDLVSNHSTNSTTQGWSETQKNVKCFQYSFPAVLFFVSSLMEIIKIGIYFFRLVRKFERIVPSTEKNHKAAIQLATKSTQLINNNITTVKRSFSAEDIRDQRPNQANSFYISSAVQVNQEFKRQKLFLKCTPSAPVSKQLSLESSRSIDNKTLKLKRSFSAEDMSVQIRTRHRKYSLQSFTTQVNSESERKVPTADTTSIQKNPVIQELFVKSSSLTYRTNRSKLNKSFSAENVRLQTGEQKKQCLPPSTQTLQLNLKPALPKLPSTLPSGSAKKTVLEPIKNFLLRSSSITFVMSMLSVCLLINFQIKLDRNDLASSSISLIIAYNFFVLVLPVLLIFFDNLVLDYIKSFLL